MTKKGQAQVGEEENIQQEEGFLLPSDQDVKDAEEEDGSELSENSLPSEEDVEPEKPEGEADSGSEEEPEGAAGEGEEGSGEKDDEEEIDLDELFQMGEDSKDALDETKKVLEEIGDNGASKEEVDILKEQVARLESANNRLTEQLGKISADKSELVVKNAELMAFGGDFTDNNVLILSKNLEKARNGDDKSKGRAVAVCKTIIEELTGEDYDLEKIDSGADALSKMESYNNKSKADVPSSEKEDEIGLTY